MIQEDSEILNHHDQQQDYRVLQLSAPAIGPLVRPGQFIELLVPHLNDAVLRRPFSVYKADKQSVTILYKVVGKGTAAMQGLAPGEKVDIIGPLGNGFPDNQEELTPVLIGGGYGAAALYLQAQALSQKGVVFFGGRSGVDILCVDEFEALGWEVRVATEDGSLGNRGLVTDSFDRWLAERPSSSDGTPRIELFACGPEGMLRAFGDRAATGGYKAWLSMDRHMACGMGACLTCVIKKRATESSWQWARCCKEGPVFDSTEIVWDE
ncbi:MAG: dihydroorotate dehydrogenase electron transfer subunit [Deltaproteobacteria bacterium]|jgi:dihydroorotate dehydrogenase electron transfer subunit|nr:dihydroorotate dehydrogenase electron transfer subunit [Deltaproteobacteria bacterium]MBT4637989.1 dihydroorotate dehydrogenase electron transfer subunit [Deltaproteobacteria bacterium]MBT6501039.1 dihydroorotate dehydrogenase electron transfer subunit [Deltaproteobacteria bacterium]MBT6612817.1 dihydroorotate dehydrogenase electron transfer subunit [Deltaproteobacteria bacterium]MBT7715415.1 dihydroorotate dehydrogenase electron transfer subunit [Deltaproteobacteria bacterium]